MRYLLLLSILTVSAAPAADRATLSGTVTDNQGKPLADATVMIYHAGVKVGYSTYCPSCYVDCGKRAVTDRAGSYTIAGLDPELVFELAVVHDGHTATFVKKVDPSAGRAPTAVLVPRAAVDDPARLFRGRVLDAGGRPLRLAVIEPFAIEADIEGRGPGSMYGTIDGLEPMTLTNGSGEFELAYKQKAIALLAWVEARGMAPKLVKLSAGAERSTITVSDGAIVRGRLMNQGKPVANAEIGLYPRTRWGGGMHLQLMGDPYDEIRIGTQADGTFVITNVPAGVDWYLYGKMESIAALGGTAPVECTTKKDGEEVDLGDIAIQPGHRVHGKVVLNDGASVAGGMRVGISSDKAWDTQSVRLAPDGQFEFIGVPGGKYEIFASVRGYREAEKDAGAIQVDHDIDNFVLALNRVTGR
jgi:Carboxypeptidase regulatory-like domain